MATLPKWLETALFMKSIHSLSGIQMETGSAICPVFWKSSIISRGSASMPFG